MRVFQILNAIEYRNILLQKKLSGIDNGLRYRMFMAIGPIVWLNLTHLPLTEFKDLKRT